MKWILKEVNTESTLWSSKGGTATDSEIQWVLRNFLLASVDFVDISPVTLNGIKNSREKVLSPS